MYLFSFRCSFEATLTAGGNIEIVVTSLTNSATDRCFCHMYASNITRALNGTTPTSSISLPSSYQYLLGATESDTVTARSTGGTPSPANVVSSLSIVALVAILVAAFGLQ